MAMVSNGDTVTCSGFVSQGVPDYCLEGLGKRFLETQEPRNLTIFFGAGPGDYDSRGLNYLAQEHPIDGSLMFRRAIGSHYGQVPMLAKQILANRVEG